MRLISAGSLVRAQSGPDLRSPRKFRANTVARSSDEGGLFDHQNAAMLRPGKPLDVREPSQTFFKTGNKQTELDRWPEIVRGPETPARMLGFERALAEARGDQ
jgi:hypothetical protein